MTKIGHLPGGVLLRLLTAADVPALHDALVRNRDHLAPYDPPRPPSFWTLEGQRERVDGLLQQQRDGRFYSFVMERDATIVGFSTLHNITYGPMCGAILGYWVGAAETGKGLAGAAVAAICEFADQSLDLHRIEASTNITNVASQRVLLRNGFEHFGTARAYLHINGVWQDSVMYQRILNDRPPGRP
ncbi:GNAT family N-acetyltransferase [Actinoplanes awajinensis]|uniref:N-acetyltransferase domain-containing protein n=1 Tax=Actinoplanes awajinensis subsp. mycoplanecinus TaxID=135947 RepID=A0A117MNS9_9ACTN|nr:GNAT family protein [Actinoplanes awajinensis]KUL27537.1 hypothetical protein ADL15_35150 [Actinoplanes awajinensis subsp. mycoplanecinus]